MFSWVYDNHEGMCAQSNFLCDARDDSVAHALEPLWGDLGAMVTTFRGFVQGRPASAANALITLWITATQGKGTDELAVACDTCLAIALHGFGPFDADTRSRFRAHFLRQLATDSHRFSVNWLGDVVKQIREAGESTASDGSEFVRMANEILPELMVEDSPRPL